MTRDPGPSAYLVEGLTVVAPLRQNLGLGLVLGLAMLGNIAIAGVVGASVPLFLRRVGLDLAVASAVVVTTFTGVFRFPAVPGRRERLPQPDTVGCPRCSPFSNQAPR